MKSDFLSNHQTIGRHLTAVISLVFSQNCCILTLTLLDEFQRPFWCVSSPVCIRMADPGSRSLSDYSGEHFRLEHHDSEGKVEMRLVWLTEEKQFFLIALSVYVPLAKVNRHFGTQY